ncbi:MAG: hypothetical protein HOO67_01545 [Candidatus Peribacteraceae bacterium]|nr:hypothetical protein [Candidatus Peribacteraceae bacterium]
MNEDTIQRTQSVINRSAVKKYALKVSAEKRAGKFTRVSDDFLVQVEADLEAAIRQLSSTVDTSEMAKPAEDVDWFITGQAVKNAEGRLNELARIIVHRKVMKHPTLGCTLK